ncbi:hypothetical protein NM688_g5285 [Phlebia brevispora]|uniref:Uncharacterized protein n=1 Tax=Phlebia brevispora TaxID=194682 RepID=A0ACC1SXR0_9APHY|nr:hypothetical protein NM688_g5285 [Phlebia brevispora]
MDIKFIGSGEAAKAILYYITNYITKSQMKAHVAYAALELAINRLAASEIDDDEETLHAKKMLQKCAFALLTHQEMSAPQVALYLLGYEERYPSHEFRNLYWMSFETYINNIEASPECYPMHDEELSDDDDENASMQNNETEGDSATHADDEEADSDMDPMEVNEHEEDTISDPVNEEVIISFDEEEGVVMKADQVSDYIYRPRELEYLSVWQFVRHTSKEHIRERRKNDEKTDESGDEMDVDDRPISEVEALSIADLETVLNSIRRRRPTYQFLSNHPECKRKHIRIRHPNELRIVVPIGAALPRRDRAGVFAKYCRLMLLLFKPWRQMKDLREEQQAWNEAFSTFQRECSSEVQAIMNNMQILHECKDNGGDHFRYRAHLIRHRLSTYADEVGIEPIEISEDVDEEDVLRHLQDCSSTRSSQSDGMSKSADACLSSALANGIYNWGEVSVSDKTQPDSTMSCEFSSNKDLEKTWQKFYATRRNQLKQKVSDSSEDKHESEKSPDESDNERHIVQFLQDAQNQREVREDNEFLPHIVAGNPRESNVDAEIQAVIEHWTLNDEQAYAFRIIARHASTPPAQKEQLRMFLGGPGGTGKSRVINALRDFFHRRGEERRFRLASYTGIAASNIGGITLHTSLGITPGSRTIRAGSKTHQDLTAMWDGVDYLFVDEVSMLGCYTLARVSEALSLAMGKIGPYGGINIIFAGDFAQLPPVGDSHLYGHVKFANHTGKSKSSLTKMNRIIYGKLLWFSVDVVVLLTKIMRQAGDANRRFVELLSRLRVGACTNSDQHILNSRVLDRLRENSTISEWKDCPVIVYDNATKDALNIQAVQAFSRQTGRELNWYYCSDRHLGQEFESDNLRSLLLEQHSGTTKGLLGRIPLVLGMRVIISKNFDLDGGVLNGSIGTLRKVRYKINKFGERQLLSCVVYVPGSTIPCIDGLAPHEVPVLEESKKWCIKSQKSKKMLQIMRTQVAIQPAYAFTCHRVQGQTFDRIIVDLQGCSGPEAPYVMLSWARSLEGVAILRPFLLKCITRSPNKRLLNENVRLQMICERAKLQGQTDGCDEETRNEYIQLTVRPEELPTADTEDAINQRTKLLRDLQLHFSLLTERLHAPGGTTVGRSSGARRRKRQLQDNEGASAGNKRRRFHDVLD